MQKNEKGFTLVESLISLSAFLIIVSVCSFSLKPFMSLQYAHRINEFEWELFLQQANQEFYQTRDFYIQNNILYLIDRNNRLISYEMYGYKLRRRVNDEGYEVLLQNVKAVTFMAVSKGIVITLQDDVRTYESVIPYHHDKGG